MRSLIVLSILLGTIAITQAATFTYTPDAENQALLERLATENSSTPQAVIEQWLAKQFLALQATFQRRDAVLVKRQQATCLQQGKSFLVSRSGATGKDAGVCQ